jgi:Iap family predicted aminopeptidase
MRESCDSRSEKSDGFRLTKSCFYQNYSCLLRAFLFHPNLTSEFMRILFFALFLISSGVVSAQMLPDSAFIRIASDAGVRADGYDRLKKACAEIGHRLTGSENAVRAEQLLHDAFLKKGLSRVEFFPFPIRIWKRNSCQLEVVPKNSDHFVAIKSVSLANAASGTGMWHLVDGSDGLESDLSAIAPNIRGNCLLMNLDLSRRESGRRNLHRAEKVSLALRYGAAAVLFVHPREAQMVLTGTASLSGDQVPVPAVCIPGKQGKEIRDWMKTHSLMAEIKVKNDISEGKARNVMGWVEAPVPTRETIVVCGHLDSWDLGTGAVDNGIGSFTIPDIAGALQKKRSLLRRNVCFLLTMGEEQGLLGSRALVAQWQKEGKLGDVKAVVNLDMTGNPQAINDFDWPGAAGFF